MATIAELAKQFNKDFKDNNLAIFSNIKPDYKRLITNAFGLDYILGGGPVLGRIIELSGVEHSGKTTAACVILAAYQRAYPEKTCVYFDIEHTLDLKFQARMTGLDLSKLLYIAPNGQSGEQLCDMCIEVLKSSDVGCVVWDSLPAALPAAVLKNDLSKDAGMQGTMAKVYHKFFPEANELVANTDGLFICTNQVRDAGKTFTGIQLYKEPCGSAPSFYASYILRFAKRKFTLGDDMDACSAKNGEGADGFRLLFKILKNKCGSCSRGGGFLTFRYNTGLDWINDLLEIALSFDFIKRLNNVTYALVDLETGEILLDDEGNELKGKKNDLVEYIKTNIPFQTKYLAMLNKAISEDDSKSYGQLLDERSNAEIEEQQDAINHQFDRDRQPMAGQ